MASSKLSSSDVRALEGLVQVSFLVQSTMSREADGQDLTATQARLLAVLADREPTMRVLAGIMGLEKSSLTGLVDRAENRGLVERFMTEESRRSVRVRLTDAGRTRCAAFLAAVGPELFALVESLSASDRKRIADLTGRVVDDYVRKNGIDATTMDLPASFG